jgi:L-fuconolactonase
MNARIDSHQHFWKYTSREYGWIDTSMAVLKRDFLPDDLLAELQLNDLHGSVAVQARQSYEETSWLLNLAEKNDFIKGIVGWVDLQDPSIDSVLEQISSHPLLKGVRHVIHDEPDDNFILKPAFLNGVASLASYGLVYDILIFSKHLPQTIEFVIQFPEQRFVIDHIAKPRIRDNEIEPWRSHMKTLAGYENVYCKLSGMITEADWQAWKPADLEIYMQTVLDLFGPGRVMFGSDWPVCTVAGTYRQVADLVKSFITSLAPGEQAAVMGDTAAKCYNL